MAKPSLSAALTKSAAGKSSQADREESLPGTEPQKVTARPARTGKKVIAGFFDPAVSRQLKQIGLPDDRSLQDLLAEALNDLFQKYRKPPIA